MTYMSRKARGVTQIEHLPIMCKTQDPTPGMAKHNIKCLVLKIKEKKLSKTHSEQDTYSNPISYLNKQ